MMSVLAGFWTALHQGYKNLSFINKTDVYMREAFYGCLYRKRSFIKLLSTEL